MCYDNDNYYKCISTIKQIYIYIFRNIFGFLVFDGFILLYGC